MTYKIAINGFGRIGRNFLKVAFEKKEIDIVAINDLTDEETLAYLLKHDSIYGRFDKKVKALSKGGKNYLVIGDKEILSLSERDPNNLPWKELGVDVVVESTGVFTKKEDASEHLKAGAKRVVITAPAKGDVNHLLPGVSDEKFDEKSSDKISSDGSCTTNAVAPVMKILSETIGVKKAVLNTIHAYTAGQNIVDGTNKKMSRGRAAAINIVPTTTGAALVTSKVVPSLKDKFDGIATRVPVACGSLADITFVSEKQTSKEEINKIFKRAQKEERWKGILKTTEEPIVSSDVIRDSYASTVDLSFTKVIDGDLVKILAWYDNEWGYCVSLLEHVLRVSKHL